MGVLICCITAPMDLNFTKLTFFLIINLRSVHISNLYSDLQGWVQVQLWNFKGVIETLEGDCYEGNMLTLINQESLYIAYSA